MCVHKADRRCAPAPRAAAAATIAACCSTAPRLWCTAHHHHSALEFMTAIMRQLLAEPDKSMSEVVYQQYYATLNKWHGFWASSAFNVSFHNGSAGESPLSPTTAGPAGSLHAHTHASKQHAKLARIPGAVLRQPP